MDASRQDRIREFVHRLSIANPARSFDLTTWETDGRMYPPQDDALRDVAGKPEVKRFRARRHNIFVRQNGAFKIEEIGGQVLVDRPGADGSTVGDP